MEHEIKIIPIFPMNLRKKPPQNSKAPIIKNTKSNTFSQILDLAIKNINSGSSGSQKVFH